MKKYIMIILAFFVPMNCTGNHKIARKLSIDGSPIKNVTHRVVEQPEK